MRIAVMGSGGVGGYFGGLLAAAGEEVAFIARGPHLAALRAGGLRVESVHGDFTVRPVRATDAPAEVGPVDLVLFATKTDAIEPAAEAMRPLVGPATTVVPLQNGVDATERAAELLGVARVVGGACYISSQLAAPGLIRQVSTFRRVIVGEPAGPVTPRIQTIADALRRAGADAEASSDILKERWTKFAFIGPFSGIGAVTRAPAGEILACPEARELLHAAIREVEAVGRSAGVALDPDVSERTAAFCDALSPHIMASMQRDLLEGRPSELESIVGAIVRMAVRLDVPVPAFRFMYAALLPQEARARGSR